MKERWEGEGRRRRRSSKNRELVKTLSMMVSSSVSILM
jgi:hypothetical protein